MRDPFEIPVGDEQEAGVRQARRLLKNNLTLHKKAKSVPELTRLLMEKSKQVNLLADVLEKVTDRVVLLAGDSGASTHDGTCPIGPEVCLVCEARALVTKVRGVSL